MRRSRARLPQDWRRPECGTRGVDSRVRFRVRLTGRRTGSRHPPARRAPSRTACRAQPAVGCWRGARTPVATEDLASTAGTGRLRQRPPPPRQMRRRPGRKSGRRRGSAPRRTTAQRYGTTTANGLRPRARRTTATRRDRPRPPGPVACASSPLRASLGGAQQPSLRNGSVRHGGHHARAAVGMSIFRSVARPTRATHGAGPRSPVARPGTGLPVLPDRARPCSSVPLG